ncbi:MAG: efflux RND transporter periplasmic adaptor subunit [Gemmatimonadetes bacterium]|nr:efflux RND transporter periplasmic adaptor subunit [Gemmatimonadota bacterium]NNK47560.1 efflux RND transporter periplasmic adaptor subunit [Gemmatimonadota bacterium]
MKLYTMLLMPVLLGSLAACGREEPGEVEAIDAAGTVDVSAAVSAESGTQIPARVVARETASLATRASGTIESIRVDVGSSVRRGQVLVRLEASGVESAVARAEAQTVAARRTFDRLQNLERDGAATRQELDQAEAALRTAEAMLAEAHSARGYVSMEAPFAGTVTARYADPGDLAVPGRPVLVISGTGGVKLEADLPATMVGVAEGEPVTVVATGSGARWPATVRRVVPVIDLASHRFRVEATFDSPGDQPVAGSFVRLEFAGRGEASAWVPSDAVIRRGQLAGVYVVDEDVARLRWIRTGRRGDDAVEVLAGLGEGALVVRDPEPGLVDGAAVRGTNVVGWVFTQEHGR